MSRLYIEVAVRGGGRWMTGAGDAATEVVGFGGKSFEGLRGA